MKCPVCGASGTMTYEIGCQYMKSHKILKSGKISKRFSYKDNGMEGWFVVRCNNCQRIWNDYHFGLDGNGKIELFGEGDGGE